MELDESFINLSVLIHLVCLITEPNGFISSDYLFYIVCLFIHFCMFHYITECDLCSDRQLKHWLPWITLILSISMATSFLFIYYLFYYPGNNGFITLATKGFP